MEPTPLARRCWSRRTIGYSGFFFSATFGALLEAWDWKHVSRRERNISLAWAAATLAYLLGSIWFGRYLRFGGADVLIIVFPFFVWYLCRGRLHEDRFQQLAGDPQEIRNGWIVLPVALLWVGLLTSAAFLISKTGMLSAG